MKRHPELQPYVPSDRDRTVTNLVARKVLIDGGSANKQPKASSSLTSSLTSNTNTTASTNYTTSGTYRATNKTKDAKPRTKHQPISSATRQTSKTRSVAQPHPPRKSSSQLSASLVSNNHDRTSITSGAIVPPTPPPPTPPPPTPTTTTTNQSSKITPTTITTSSTSIPLTTVSSSEASAKLNANNNTNNTNYTDRQSIRHSSETNGDVTIRSISSGNKTTSSITSEIEITPDIPVTTVKATVQPASDERNNTTFGVIDNQLSDMSINERLYQSATSDLSYRNVKEDISTNGDYHENHGSLFNDLEAELIAQGIVKTEPVTPKLSMSVVSVDQEESISRFESTPDTLKRVKAEEELRENARRMEEERQNRQSIIESILSKVNQSS